MAASPGNRRTPPRNDPRKRRTIEVRVRDFSKCYYCKRPLAPETTICPMCNFPMRGTEAEQRKFILEKRMERSELRDIGKSISMAKNILFFIAGVNFLFAVVNLFVNGLVGIVDFAVGILIGGIFLGMGLWARTQPANALLVSIIIYAIYTLLVLLANMLFGNIASVILGTLFRGAIIGVLAYGLAAVRKAEAIRRQQPWSDEQVLGGNSGR